MNPAQQDRTISPAPLPPDQLRDLMQLTVEQTPTAIVWAERDGRIVYANDAAARLLGYTVGELTSMTVGQVHPALTPQRWAGLWRRLDAGRPVNLEGQHRIADGRVVPVEAAVHQMRHGSRCCACWFLRDISATQRAQRETQEFSQLVSVLFDSAPLAIVGLDGDGRVKMWNVAAVRLFGWAAGEVLGQPLPFAPADRGEELAEVVRDVQAGQSRASVELTCLRKDGRPIDTRMTVVPLLAPDGHVTGGVSLIEDISEHKRLEAQFLQAQRLESVGRLAGAVAHDFNNLLTVINGYSEIGLLHLDPRDPLYESVHEIKAAGDRAASLTQQLLAFSRRQVLQPKVLDIDAVVGELEPMLRRLIGEDIELVRAHGEAPGAVKADPNQIQQVLMNLAVNARDAMPEGGKLVIETSNVELDDQAVRHHPETTPGSYVLLAVSDTGTGMDEATQGRLFEPFFTTKAPGKGTGLGLSTVYGIVRQSGGHIWVYSEPGHGTSFKIYLPRVDVAAQAAPDGEAPAAEGKGTETVLLVEDQDEVRQLAVHVLTMYGYRVLAAANGAEALAIARQEQAPIHVLVTDIVMPGMGGTELAAAVVALRPAIRIVLMSGYADHAAVRLDRVPEGAAYIQKPFTPASLARKVREVLDRRPAAGRILVVDDEAEIRHLLRQILEGAGYVVTEASEGRQAVAEVEAGGVALVITDLVMPEQEGIETIRAMRGRHPEVRIVAMSGAFGGRFLRTAQILGAHATLLKPVTAETLVRTVREVLAQ